MSAGPERRRLLGLAAVACAACCAPLLPAAAVVVGIGGAAAAATGSVAAAVRRGRIPVTGDPDIGDHPIACTLAPEDVPGRLDLLGRLRGAATAVDRTERGLRLAFPAEPDVAADAHRFAVEEQRCCAFWDFEVVETAEQVELRWDGPPGAAGLLDELHTALAGDADLASLGGLL